MKNKERDEFDIFDILLGIFNPKYQTLYRVGIKVEKGNPVLGDVIKGIALLAAIKNYHPN